MKLLIISRYFPPYNEVGGFRAEAWYKYLPDRDINVKVITNKHSNSQSTNDLYRVDLKEFINVGNPLKRYLLQVMGLPGFNQKSRALQAISSFVKDYSPDLIITTGPPFGLFFLTSYLSKKYRTPWIADYRDAWTNNVSYLCQKRGLKYAVKSLLERAAVSSAKFVTAASPVYADRILEVCPNKRVEVVYNGFFQEEFRLVDQETKSEEESKELSISYLGTLYKFQDVETFLEGVAQFESQSSIKTIGNFYGLKHQNGATKRVEDYSKKLAVHCLLTDKIPRIEVIQKASSSDALLLICNPDVPQLYAKVFDYIALKKPIIVINAEKYMVSFLEHFENVFYCSSPKEVAASLEKVANGITTISNSTEIKLTQFTREAQTKVLADLLVNINE